MDLKKNIRRLFKTAAFLTTVAVATLLVPPSLAKATVDTSFLRTPMPGVQQTSVPAKPDLAFAQLEITKPPAPLLNGKDAINEALGKGSVVAHKDGSTTKVLFFSKGQSREKVTEKLVENGVYKYNAPYAAKYMVRIIGHVKALPGGQPFALTYDQEGKVLTIETKGEGWFGGKLSRVYTERSPRAELPVVSIAELRKGLKAEGVSAWQIKKIVKEERRNEKQRVLQKAVKEITQKKNVRPFFVDAAITYFRKTIPQNKRNPGGECAKSVRLGMEAGGLPLAYYPEHAKHYKKYLERRGFVPVKYKGVKSLQKGDIILVRTLDGTTGHLSFWNGNEAVSDYRQGKNVSPYSTPSRIQVYRYPHVIDGEKIFSDLVAQVRVTSINVAVKILPVLRVAGLT